MKKSLKFILAGTMGATLFLSATPVMANTQSYTLSELLARETGETVESIVQVKVESGKTFGEIANEYGVLDEFKKENLEIKREMLNSRVANGLLTQTEADLMYNQMLEYQENCDGTGTYSGGYRLMRENGQVLHLQNNLLRGFGMRNR